ncbi:MAG TPA: hypothetical protein VF596_06130 [Pyrinomonadaceae bacterium]
MFRNNRRNKKVNGLCQYCSEPVAADSTSYCEKHRYEAARGRKSQTEVNAGKRSFKQRRKKQGLCIWCPSPVSDRSTQHCEIHREKAIQSTFAYQQKRKALGICQGCPAPSSLGYLFCENCRAKKASKRSGLPIEFHLAALALRELKKEIKNNAQK